MKKYFRRQIANPVCLSMGRDHLGMFQSCNRLETRKDWIAAAHCKYLVHRFIHLDLEYYLINRGFQSDLPTYRFEDSQLNQQKWDGKRRRSPGAKTHRHLSPSAA